MELCDVLYARRVEEQGYTSPIVEDMLIFLFLNLFLRLILPWGPESRE